MKKAIIITISILLIAAMAAGGYFYLRYTSPEYALAAAMEDMKASGVEGLKPHLTTEAAEKLETVEAWGARSGISGLLDIFTDGGAEGFLMEHLSEVDWTVEDILRGKQQAEVQLGFQYKDVLSGTVEVVMQKEGLSWKIAGIETPRFDSISLPGSLWGGGTMS